MAAAAVILKPVPSSIYTDTDLDPQIIQYRSPNVGIIYIDSGDSVLEIDKTNMIVSTIKTPQDRANVLAQNIKRLSIIGVGANWQTPNVNPRNNVFTFLSSNTGATQHTVTFTEGFYQTSASLITEILAQLNSLTGTTGLTFTAPAVTGFPDKYTLTSAGGSYRIINTSNAITRGRTLYCFQIDEVLSTTKTVGSMGLLYTTYIDFCSAKLNSYTRIPSRSNGSNYNILFRAYFPPLSATQAPLIPLNVGFFVPPQLNSINYLYTDSISQFDMQLKDQWGDFLYVPPGTSCFNWDMEISVEF